MLCAESSFTGWKLLRGGELLMPDEMVLGHDETYASPWLYVSWGEGLDAFSDGFPSSLARCQGNVEGSDRGRPAR